MYGLVDELQQTRMWMRRWRFVATLDCLVIVYLVVVSWKACG